MSAPTVVCVLRSGGEYKPEHVMALMRGVRTYWPDDWPLRFVVLSDVCLPDEIELVPLRYDWPGWWSKMELFRPDLDYLGDILFFDLDTVIVGDLTDISGVQELTLLSDFYRNTHIASGMMFLPLKRRVEMWAVWKEGKARGSHRGDQEFMRTVWNSEQRWQNVLPGQVVSYKVHVKPTQCAPEDARVVCFHGRPRPWQVGWLRA